MSDRSTGYRRIVSLGNTNHDTTWTIKGLENGTYYWNVQSIDNSFAGSSFSSEQSFTIFKQFSEQKLIPIQGVYASSVAWGDYDNDGDLDILLTGFAGSNNISKIYRNNGDNTFTEQTSISLTGVINGSVAWGDYDNDGDLDILLTGYTGSSYVSKIYRNNGDNTFTEQTAISLTGVINGSVAWGDCNNDGYLDLLLTGNYVSKIYLNNKNNTFSELSLSTLPVVDFSSVAWGDYDNDGDLDVLLTGLTGWPISVPESKIYRNNGDSTFTSQSSIFLTGVFYSSVAWGDYDNDGDLDILLTGESGSGPVSKIYRNNGDNTFTEQTSISLIGVSVGSSAWGDYTLIHFEVSLYRYFYSIL
ncbi:VCBS repeat-containing protein, partial [Dolichospermum sp. ST_sed5]|nr:VCBS repeat-containing protein [Dolichospermum sp. ST_sed5]